MIENGKSGLLATEIWKDHVNVLDQRRIFRLLAKGPTIAAA